MKNQEFIIQGWHIAGFLLSFMAGAYTVVIIMQPMIRRFIAQIKAEKAEQSKIEQSKIKKSTD